MQVETKPTALKKKKQWKIKLCSGYEIVYDGDRIYYTLNTKEA